MDLERHRRVFDSIASIYSWFFKGQIKKYTRIISTMKEHYPSLLPPSGSKVLDIDCGTGAFTRALELSGYRAEGVDISRRMVQIAREHNLRCRITTIEENGELPSRLPYDDNSFDMVTAAQVVHGLESEARGRLFNEARRIFFVCETGAFGNEDLFRFCRGIERRTTCQLVRVPMTQNVGPSTNPQ